jgi:hypothetical protein
MQYEVLRLPDREIQHQLLACAEFKIARSRVPTPDTHLHAYGALPKRGVNFTFRTNGNYYFMTQ